MDEITHVWVVNRTGEYDPLYVFVDCDQAREYAGRYPDAVLGEEVVMNRSAGAQFITDTYDPDNEVRRAGVGAPVMDARDIPSQRDHCDECAHPERLHDERIRVCGTGLCPTCSVCAAEAETAAEVPGRCMGVGDAESRA